VDLGWAGETSWFFIALAVKAPYYVYALSHTAPHTNLHMNRSTQA
jgi:hypothetical protein